MGKQSEALRAEVTYLQQTNAELRNDLQKLARTERVATELSERLDELATSNQRLNEVVEEKQAQLSDLIRTNRDLMAEKMSLSSAADTFDAQIRARDDSIRAHEEKATRLAMEVERLRARQIAPDLAQTIRDTQSLLQAGASTGMGQASSYSYPIGGMTMSPTGRESGRLGTGEVEGGGKSGYSATVTTTALHLLREERVAVGEITSAADLLVRRSSDLMSRYESSSSNSPIMSQNRLAQDLFELLDSNSRLTLQTQQLALDLR